MRSISNSVFATNQLREIANYIRIWELRLAPIGILMEDRRSTVHIELHIGVGCVESFPGPRDDAMECRALEVQRLAGFAHALHRMMLWECGRYRLHPLQLRPLRT